MLKKFVSTCYRASSSNAAGSVLRTCLCNPLTCQPSVIQHRNVSKSDLKEMVERQRAKGASALSPGLDADFDEDEVSNAGALFRKRATKEPINYPVITSDYPYGNDMSTLYYNGIHYNDIPIIKILCTGNTMATLVTVKDNVQTSTLLHSTTRTEGFASKKSLVASQGLGQAMARRALKKKIQFVRVVLKGYGSGRESCMKGLYIGGLNIVSITDVNLIRDYYTRARPRKQKKV